MKSRHAGHSLLEVMVAVALTSILLLCTQQLLAAAARYYTNAQYTMELQEGLLVASSRIQVELGESNNASIVVDPGPAMSGGLHQGVVFITPRDNNGNVTTSADGKAQWGRMVCFYTETIQGSPCLVWKEQNLVPIPPPVPPYPAVPAPWDKVSSWLPANGQPHLVARNITSFSVTDTTPLLIVMTSSDQPVLPVPDYANPEPDPSAKYFFKVEARVQPKN